MLRSYLIEEEELDLKRDGGLLNNEGKGRDGDCQKEKEGKWAVYYTSPQCFITTFCYSFS